MATKKQTEEIKNEVQVEEPNALYANKIVYNGNVLIDLTGDTVQPSDVINAKQFHASNGQAVTGTCTYDADTSDATAQASEILSGKTAYKAGSKITGTMENWGGYSDTITDAHQAVTLPAGYYDGSGNVIIDEDEVEKIVPENIVNGVTILGCTGTATEAKIEPKKTVTPTATGFNVTPASGFNGMAEVEVLGIPYTETENPQGGLTVTIG